MESTLTTILRNAFPPLGSGDLAYLRRPGLYAPRLLAHRATIGEISVEQIGCTRGRVCAVTCELAEWEQTEAGALEVARWTQTYSVEFDSEADLLNAETWARELRRRVARDNGMVVGIEAGVEIMVRAGRECLEVAA